MKQTLSKIGVAMPIIAFALFAAHAQAVTTSPVVAEAGQQSEGLDPVIQKIWAQGDQSQLYSLGQELLDSIGPRLTGTAQQRRANDWALAWYRKWGIPAHSEQYGTWMDWRRGIAHIDLVGPIARPLEGMLSTWSPGTKGTVEGPVVLFPKIESPADLEAAISQMRGKFVLFSFPWASCRPDADWKEFAAPESFERMHKERSEGFQAWYGGRLRKSGLGGTALVRRLAEVGALGIITSLVPPPGPQGWGVYKISTTIAENIPELGLSCEDYGLLFRLAENNQNPILRVNAEAEFKGEVPVSNVLAELRGTEKPNEYVVLSSHLDSWDPASGATDNGSGTVVMMEAMRILKSVYPNPKRTILAAHWTGEEQGLNGSSSFAADHPEVLQGLDVVFNQDSGTGRITNVSMQGFTEAASLFRRWFSQMPSQVRTELTLTDPGTPGGGSDEMAFVCRGVPAFSLDSKRWNYEAYTWHTNRDTFDKLVFDELSFNARVIALLAYLAAEDPRTVPREPRVTANDPATGKPKPWPNCVPAARDWAHRRK